MTRLIEALLSVCLPAAAVLAGVALAFTIAYYFGWAGLLVVFLFMGLLFVLYTRHEEKRCPELARRLRAEIGFLRPVMTWASLDKETRARAEELLKEAQKWSDPVSLYGVGGVSLSNKISAFERGLQATARLQALLEQADPNCLPRE